MRTYEITLDVYNNSAMTARTLSLRYVGSDVQAESAAINLAAIVSRNESSEFPHDDVEVAWGVRFARSNR